MVVRLSVPQPTSSIIGRLAALATSRKRRTPRTTRLTSALPTPFLRRLLSLPLLSPWLVLRRPEGGKIRKALHEDQLVIAPMVTRPSVLTPRGPQGTAPEGPMMCSIV